MTEFGKPGDIGSRGRESFSQRGLGAAGSVDFPGGRPGVLPTRAIEILGIGKGITSLQQEGIIMQAAADSGDKPQPEGAGVQRRRPGQMQEGLVSSKGENVIISPLLTDEASAAYATRGKEPANDLSKRLSGQPLKESPPDYQAILKAFTGGGQGSLSRGEIILTERAISLMDPVRSEALRFGNGSPEVMSRARSQFRDIAESLDNRTLDLKAFVRDHPKCRSVLTLIASLTDEPIPDRARLHTLRGMAIDTLQQRTDLLNDTQIEVIKELYGLMDGRVKNTAEVAESRDLTRNVVRNIERVTLGLQDRGYHPERHPRVQE